MEEAVDQIAYLPDGQKVRIEYVADGVATVTRVGGEWDGMIAVCAVNKLKPTSPEIPRQEPRDILAE